MSSAVSLDVQGLTVAYQTAGEPIVAVRDVDLGIDVGRVTGLAGESGSGKSTLALAAIGYAAPGVVIIDGSVTLDEQDLYLLTDTERRRIWGAKIGFVAQNALDGLNPAMRIGAQLGEVIRIHEGVRDEQLRARIIGLLERVGIPDPVEALRRYPHQFSGGQQQRIAIAAAIACSPQILILDEPTTGLDVQTQRQISELLLSLVSEQGLGALYVSHDLGLLGEVCDDMYVMYAGQIVEHGAAPGVLRRPRHPYTRAMLDAAPSVDEPRMLIGIPGRPPANATTPGCPFAPRCQYAEQECSSQTIELVGIERDRASRCRRQAELALSPAVTPLRRVSAAAELQRPVLEVRDMSVRYGRATADAVHAVSLRVRPGESLGLVGESGSGKSTLLRTVAGLIGPTQGQVLLRGTPLHPRVERRNQHERRAVQLIFQNPDSSLNPTHTVGDIVTRPLRVFGRVSSRREESHTVGRLLERVGLGEEIAYRYPDELSGGQKQRVAIARAFAAGPDLLLCDEITSALDVSVQATIVTLLDELVAAEHVAVVFVTHDMALVRTVAPRIAVMKDGAIIEEGDAAVVFNEPQADYTRRLLAAIPSIGQHDPSTRPAARVCG